MRRRELVQARRGGAARWFLFLLAACAASCSSSSNPFLVSLALDPVAPSMAAGSELRLQATGVYSDGETADVSVLAGWSSSDAAVVAVHRDGCARVLAQGLAAGSAMVTARLAGIEATTTVDVTAATLTALEVFPQQTTLAMNTTRRYRAVGTYSDARTQDVTEQVAWSSSDPLAAAVSNAPCSKGEVQTLAPAAVTIATEIDGVSGSAGLVVTAATLSALEIAPLAPTLARGTSLQLSATGTFSDGSTQDLTDSVAWSSSDAAVATVDGAQGSEGLLQAVDAGTAQIGAALGSVSAATTATVKAATLVALEIAPAGPSLAAGTTQQLSAIGTFSDSSTQDLTTAVTCPATTRWWRRSPARAASRACSPP